jgi:hypothetical protein
MLIICCIYKKKEKNIKINKHEEKKKLYLNNYKIDTIHLIFETKQIKRLENKQTQNLY